MAQQARNRNPRKVQCVRTQAGGRNRAIRGGFRRYPEASAIGLATVPPTGAGGLSMAALNRMIAGEVRVVQEMERATRRP